MARCVWLSHSAELEEAQTTQLWPFIASGVLSLSIKKYITYSCSFMWMNEVLILFWFPLKINISMEVTLLIS